MARSIERGPLSLEKLSITDGSVSYTTSGGAAHEFDALEFLALLSSHIPKPYESVIRYYGYYSCQARGERRGYAPEGEAFSAQQLERAPSASWAACVKRIFEFNPLECPRCRGEMRIIVFLTDERVILKIADSLGVPRAQAPPKIFLPRDKEFFDELPPDKFD